ncbi:MAG: hypothetical protein CMO55_05535 [Verrucomicrobiales bacterium]|nr:hypothetical protein [Verrucomicrobiales bacterium]
MADSSQIESSARQTDGDLSIPSRLQHNLETFQERLWSVKMAEGALAGIVGLGFSYLIVFILDRFVDTPSLVRLLILLSGFLVPALGLPLRWKQWVWRQRSLEQLSRLLRRRFPRLGDELLGIVELARRPGSGASQTLVAAAMKQVDERLQTRNFCEAVPARHYGTWLAAAVALLALSTLLACLVNEASRNALVRWVSPWKQVDRYTFTKIEDLPQKVFVPYAENFDLAPTLAEDSEWRPDIATIRLPGKSRIASERDGEVYDFNIPPQKENGSLSLRIGDVKETIEVKPLPRPELTELSAVLRLPDYLRYESDPVVPIRGNSITLVEGAVARFRGTASRDLADASANGIAASIDGPNFETDPQQVDEAFTSKLTWSDVHGLKAKSDLEIQVVPTEDTPPDIFAKMLTDERVILEDEVVSFDVSALDDFGIKKVGIEWRPAQPLETPEASQGEKPVAAGGPESKEIQARATFSAAREGVSPQTLHVRAFAEDFLPDRQRSFSPTFVLHVLAPTEHAKWLTEEFGKWFRHAREVYEQERQLYETNKSLRSLTAEELDRPENRRRLEEQASAETGNARRLDALTDSGRDLVQQATKNNEFDANRLETWAEMMRALDDIAENRMPSVSDLLKKSSHAAGGTMKKPEEQSGKQNSEQSESTSATSPSVSDREKALVEDESSNNSPEKAGKNSSALGLPQTMLDSVAEEDTKEATEPQSEAQQKLDEALDEQDDLINEFAKVADELQQILSSLEASTFVKRFKAASRKQTEIAKRLNGTLGSSFGLAKHRIEQQLRDVAEETAVEQEEQSRFIYDIQSDLEAYFQRKQESLFENVLLQMKDASVVSNIKSIGESTRTNLNGRSIAASEFWADTLDRWAEELVAAAEESGKGDQKEGQEKDGLPPEIVLQIMKVLHEEMQLRDETREMESARPGLSPDVYEEKTQSLEYTQQELRERTDEVVTSISELPDASRQFGKELQLLSLVSDIMRESRAVLARPDTGDEAVAAQTEAIELLLQSKRQKKPQGGGGSGSSPGGGASATGNGSALSDIGPGGTANGSPAIQQEREVEQTTGKAGRQLPEEFRNGLDNYFNTLESE